MPGAAGAEGPNSIHPLDVCYVRSGDVAIAYQVVGTGSPDVVFLRGFRLGIVRVWV